MARVHCVDNEVIVCAKDIVAVLSSSFDKGKIELNLKKLLKVTNVGASADRDCLEKEGTVEGDENGKSGGTEKIVEVVNSTLSKDGSLFGVALTNKTCIVYDRLNDWSERLPHFIFSKCPTSLVFDAENYNLLIADRAGNVFHRHLKSNAPLCDRCDHCEESESVEKPILGHLSMLLDMAISEDGRYVLTSDRDEKLRISRYPQTFVIHQYCLSHSSYINCVNVFKDVCFTSGGDGLILAWNIDDGSLLCTESTFRNQPVRCTRIRPSSEDVVRIGCALKDSSVVHVFEYSRSRNAFRNIKVVECTGVVYDMTFVSGRDCLLVLTRNGLWSASLSHELQTTSVSGITKQLYDAISQSRYEFVSMEKNVMFNNVEKYLEKKEDREKQRKRKREISA